MPSPVTAEVVETARTPVGQGLSQQIAKNIEAVETARRARGPAAKTRLPAAKLAMQTHQDIGSHLQAFAQKPPARGKTAEPSEPPLPATAAAGLAAMLGNAESLQQAIVINEILQRPLHRW